MKVLFRTFVAGICFVLITIVIPALSLVLGLVYWFTFVGPVLDYFYPRPNPLIFMMRIYTAAVWKICFHGIMQMEMVVVDIGPPEPFPSTIPTGKVLNVLLGPHPSNETLFSYIFYEMSHGGNPWLNIAVKMTQAFYPHGIPGLLCACFTFVIRGSNGWFTWVEKYVPHYVVRCMQFIRKKAGEYSQSIIERTILRAIERAVTFVIFGDGTRFKKKKLKKAKSSPKQWERDAARNLNHVMPPRVTGMKTILEVAAKCDAQVVVHPRVACIDKEARLLLPWTLFGRTIYIFRFPPIEDMTPENAQKRMIILWMYFDRICADPAKYVQKSLHLRSSKIA